MSFRSRLWSTLSKVKMSKSFGIATVAGLGVMMAGKLSSNPQMVATYAFGGHIEGSSTYPKRPIIPYLRV
jgi:hypothetical protein